MTRPSKITPTGINLYFIQFPRDLTRPRVQYFWERSAGVENWKGDVWEMLCWWTWLDLVTISLFARGKRAGGLWVYAPCFNFHWTSLHLFLCSFRTSQTTRNSIICNFCLLFRHHEMFRVGHIYSKASRGVSRFSSGRNLSLSTMRPPSEQSMSSTCLSEN